jgi:TRAP-type C4-dicarboxylate transport system permease small subunit
MGRVFDRLIGFTADLAGLFIAFIVVSVCLEVVTRHVLNDPLSWTVEVTEYLQLYIAFFGAAVVLRDRGHVRLDLIVGKTGLRTRKVLGIVTNLLGVCTVGTIFLFSSRTVYRTFMLGTPVIKALEIPKWLVLIPIPVGCLLLALEFTRRLIRPSRGV